MSQSSVKPPLPNTAGAINIPNSPLAHHNYTWAQQNSVNFVFLFHYYYKKMFKNNDLFNDCRCSCFCLQCQKTYSCHHKSTCVFHHVHQLHTRHILRQRIQVQLPQLSIMLTWLWGCQIHITAHRHQIAYEHPAVLLF